MDFNQLYEIITDYTLLDVERIHSLWMLVNDINIRKIGGDIVESGCSRGGSSAVLRAGMGSQRRLWIYDSFQGLPAPSTQDGGKKHYVGECAASVKDVLEILTVTGASKEEFVIRQGWFRDTFKQELPERVALLHCDVDWSESVSLVLETFYPLIPKGGTIILDDFGHWEGCRIAFFEFCERYGEHPLLERVGYTQAFWVKGKRYNRNG
ncbi:MAG: TylF/MycF/NovP-related O-methyltransferase [Candidatus Hodarchaeota archaeon]